MRSSTDFRFLLSGLFILAFCFIACKKEKIPSSDHPINLPFQNEAGIGGIGFRSASIDTIEEANYDKYVNTAAHGIIALSRDSAFRRLVYQKALEEFDGDDNVLLRTIRDALHQNGKYMIHEFQTSIGAYDGQLIETSNPLLSTFQSLDVFIDSADVEKAIMGFD